MIVLLIGPLKLKDDQGDGDLFGEDVGDDESGDPDPNNPYDFRHFLDKEKEKRSDESEYHNASSPDDRTGTGSATFFQRISLGCTARKRSSTGNLGEKPIC